MFQSSISLNNIILRIYNTNNLILITICAVVHYTVQFNTYDANNICSIHKRSCQFSYCTRFCPINAQICMDENKNNNISLYMAMHNNFTLVSVSHKIIHLKCGFQSIVYILLMGKTFNV